jgi:protein-S-isoprenylcysteine O-methyltransferase Ste14
MIRHPIYAGDLVLVIGLQLALNSWMVLIGVLLIPVVLRQAWTEEAMLSRAFPEYGPYAKSTARFIPFIL